MQPMAKLQGVASVATYRDRRPQSPNKLLYNGSITGAYPVGLALFATAAKSMRQQ